MVLFFLCLIRSGRVGWFGVSSFLITSSKLLLQFEENFSKLLTTKIAAKVFHRVVLNPEKKISVCVHVCVCMCVCLCLQ